MIKLEKELNVVIDAALKAGQIIMKYYNTDYTVEEKADKTPLTIADTESNQLICDIILKNFGCLRSNSNSRYHFLHYELL